MPVALLWFEKNLRLQDNPALQQAASKGFTIIPVYIYDTSPEQPWPLGSAAQWWLHHSLTSLSEQIRSQRGQLLLRRGHSEQILFKMIQDFCVKAVFFEEAGDPYTHTRNQKIFEKMAKIGVESYGYQSRFLLNPSEIKNHSGDFFKVFTPFWKHAHSRIMLRSWKQETSYPWMKEDNQEKPLEKGKLVAGDKQALENYWQPGELGAQEKLAQFLSIHLDSYPTKRDFPEKAATSQLSAYLNFGEISPNQVYQAVLGSGCSVQAQEAFLRQLGWREFFNYLYFYFPKLPEANFQKKYDQFNWIIQEDWLSAWKEGKTGYPIVDAGMRELLSTGFMHNRVRMIVASFLTKDLLLHWTQGEKWFFEHLVDADVANNAASWQWVAGCGPDPVPFFRIFNPVLQSKKFDPEGDYIKKWVPELSELTTAEIHEPWKALHSTSGYPKPVINHAQQRKKALTYYRQLIDSYKTK